MAGFTTAQLVQKAANIKQYTWCRRCRLYWSRRGFAKHRHASQARDVVKIDMPLMRRPRSGEVAIINPAYERFIDALADLLLKDLLTNPPARERAKKARATSSKRDARRQKPESDVLTVDEAVQRLGISRVEIMAAFEKARGVPIEVVLK